MLTSSISLRSTVIGLAGLLGFSILLAGLAASDFRLTFFDTVSIYTPEGKVGVTRHNPFGIVVLAVMLGVVGAALTAAASKTLPMIGGILGRRSKDPLRREAARITDILHKLVDLNGNYSASLASANASLDGKSEAEAVGKILVELVAEQQKIRNETSKLADELENKEIEKKAIEQKLSQTQAQGKIDALTGIGNRRAFDEALAAAIVACREARTPLSLVMADIDHFKRINDSFGHPVGDEVIKMLARIITTSLRNSDVAVRYGGEEFAIILPNAGLDVAKSVAERIRKKFESRKVTLRETGDTVGKVTASFGVAELRVGDDAETLVQRSDRKLYAAKSAGRNRVIG